MSSSMLINTECPVRTSTSSSRTAFSLPEVGREGISSSTALSVGDPTCTKASPTARLGRQSLRQEGERPIRSRDMSRLSREYFLRMAGDGDGAVCRSSRGSYSLSLTFQRPQHSRIERMFSKLTTARHTPIYPRPPHPQAAQCGTGRAGSAVSYD